jgi:hypothetical protein
MRKWAIIKPVDGSEGKEKVRHREAGRTGSPFNARKRTLSLALLHYFS